jgi:hypothetical protein
MNVGYNLENAIGGWTSGPILQHHSFMPQKLIDHDLEARHCDCCWRCSGKQKQSSCPHEAYRLGKMINIK